MKLDWHLDKLENSAVTEKSWKSFKMYLESIGNKVRVSFLSALHGMSSCLEFHQEEVEQQLLIDAP